jgi:hypothetical protein
MIMNEEELKKYLKKHLKVKVKQSYSKKIEVQILLDNEVISEDSSSYYSIGQCGPM